MVQLLAMAADGRDNLSIIDKEHAQQALESVSGEAGDKYAWRFFSAYWNQYAQEESDVFH